MFVSLLLMVGVAAVPHDEAVRLPQGVAASSVSVPPRATKNAVQITLMKGERLRSLESILIFVAKGRICATVALGMARSIHAHAQIGHFPSNQTTHTHERLANVAPTL